MGKDLKMVFDPISERIYVERDNNGNDKTLVDVTEDFYDVLFTFLPPDMIRAFGNGYPASKDYDENLLICAKNEPKSLLREIGAINEYIEERYKLKKIRFAEKEGRRWIQR